MKPHDWRAVPYDESVAAGTHRKAAPYAWRCSGCGALARTVSEAEPQASGSDWRKALAGVEKDCDEELVKRVLKD